MRKAEHVLAEASEYKVDILDYRGSRLLLEVLLDIRDLIAGRVTRVGFTPLAEDITAKQEKKP